MRRDLSTLTLLFLACVAIFLATLRLPRADGLLIGSDGILYYCYVRSLAIDGDLDLGNEYAHFGPLAGIDAASPPTPAGRPPNRMPIGMAIVWMPFFLAAHSAASLLGYPVDGYGTLHQAAVCLGSMIYGWIGLLLSYRLCREYADATSALIAVVVMWLGTNIIYYMVAEPSMSHMASLGLVAVLLAWWRFGEASVLYWVGLGALGGMAALVRPQDGLFLLLPVIDWGHRAIGLARIGSARLRRHVVAGALMLFTALAVYAIQLWAWWLIYGSLLDSSYLYGGAHRFAWLQPHIFDVLFSLRHGLFTWHPLYLAATVGLCLLARRNAAYAGLCLLAVVCQIYIVGAWDRWWQGDAFGGRMFISCGPVFAVGLAVLVQTLRHLHWAVVALPALILVLWNAAFLVQYRFDFIPRNGAITMEQLVWDKLTLPLELGRR